MNTESHSRIRASNAITDDEINKFLSWLATDKEEAGRKYQDIHRCLTAIFIRRGYADAEEMADEVIDRVIRRVARDNSFDGDDRIPYFVRAAHNLHVERQRKKPPILQPTPPHTDSDPELEDLCLEQCLRHLEPDQRDLILRYYQDDKRAKIQCRKRLAEEIGLTIEDLRLKIHRIKARLRPCLKDCLAQANN
jgi:DNA-directed RNA polymerase specialized sigma24 family protein